MFEVSGRLTDDDFDDTARLVRSRWYWPKVLLQGAHGVLLIAAIVWATVLGLVGRSAPNWRAMGIIWLVIIGIGVWSAISARRERRADLARLNAQRPESMTVGPQGITWSDSEKQITIPWGNVRGWHERGRVIVLEGPGDQVFIFTVAGLTQDQRDGLRRFLRTVVPTSE